MYSISNIFLCLHSSFLVPNFFSLARDISVPALKSNKIFFYLGHSGVICEGLNHLAIPDGWKWGGRVSEHCPVWAEIYISDNLRIPATTPLSNGISKIPVDLISDSVTENLINEKTKEKNKGFWERNWIWRYNKQHVTCEKATGKENGSL